MFSTSNESKARVIRKVAILVSFLIVLSSLLVHLPACKGSPSVFKIGVMLPLTGPDSLDSEEVLNWALKSLNDSGGIGGIPVQLEYRDTHNQDIQVIAEELIKDDSIQIVIGPQKSSEVKLLASLFIENQRLLISPMATSADISRAYGGKDYIWRTVQSDIGQVRSILYELSVRSVKRIALVYVDNDYGRTFLEWTGFFCTELDIDLTSTVGYNNSSILEDVIDEALKGNPEYILAAGYSEAAVEFKKLLDQKGSNSRLFLTDAAETPYLVEQLGTASEGLELISPAADPESDFEEKYHSDFGYYPYDYAAPTYDALLLAVYTLARQEHTGGMKYIFRRESVQESFTKVIAGTGEKVRWNDYSNAIGLLLRGESPDVQGTSGPLEFDKESGVDPVRSFYSLNRVETRDGATDFWTIRRFSSSESEGVGVLDKDSSAVFTRASHKYMALDQSTTGYHTGERRNLLAVIISTSNGWGNYRHQSDALAVYQLLRENGLSDDNIILFSVDDIPWLKENRFKGDVHHEIKGSNLRDKAIIDYSGDKVTVDNLRNVSLGRKSENTSLVLESDENTNVLVYIAGHGRPRALSFTNGDLLTSTGLAQLVDEMYSSKRYRQMLMILESCYGESLAMNIQTPGFVLLTGASRIESSFGATYDHDIGQWLADDFTREVLQAIKWPGMTLEKLYLSTYRSVKGSHVRLVNYANFGSIQIPVTDFVKP